MPAWCGWNHFQYTTMLHRDAQLGMHGPGACECVQLCIYLSLVGHVSTTTIWGYLEETFSSSNSIVHLLIMKGISASWYSVFRIANPYIWYLQYNNAQYFIREMLTWLVNKKPQLEINLAFWCLRHILVLVIPCNWDISILNKWDFPIGNYYWRLECMLVLKLCK